MSLLPVKRNGVSYRSVRQLKAKKENGENKGRFGLHLGVDDYQLDKDEYS